MKQIFLIFLSTVLISSSLFGWGENGHKMITKHAVAYLPSEMKDFQILSDYLIKNCLDPDHRKKYIKDEANKHYINIDYYTEFNHARMIESKDSLVKVYGDSVVTEYGVLPWALEKTFDNLVDAMQKHNLQATKEMMRDMAHYLADAFQPMHTVSNYNGQFTGQLDIHERYETYMINQHLNELDASFGSCGTLQLIASPLHIFFETIARSNATCPVLFTADDVAVRETHRKYDSLYYTILWFKTKAITEEIFQAAAAAIASIYYTAWVVAGKPEFNSLK